MRKLATAAAVSLALASSRVLGLGLGDIEMQSALNQPMSAEIPLTSVTPGELDGMIVRLASEEAFARAGINRSSTLSDLNFSIDQSTGAPVIKIESSQPVQEPFLNFLLEVDWPQGRMVREYTVLLDPPVFISPGASSPNSAVDQPAIVQSGETALVVPTPIERAPDAETDGVNVNLSELQDAPSEPALTLEEATSGSAPALEAEAVTIDTLPIIGSDEGGVVVALSDLAQPNTAAEEQRGAVVGATESSGNTASGQNNQQESPDQASLSDTDAGSVSLDNLDGESQPDQQRVEVRSGDTLFEIARDVAPAGASIQQMMIAMLAANESAFIDGNINLVRAGTILRIPDSVEVAQITQGQAQTAIAEQNQLWQDYRDSLRANTNTQVAQDITDDITNTEEVPAPEEDVQVSVEPEPVVEIEEVEEVEEVEAVVPDEPTEVAEIADSEAPVETVEEIDSTQSAEDLAEEAGLSLEARAILENARRELEGSPELNIVADNTETDSVASATADETADSDLAARIGEVNLKLQMAREELSAARMEAEDLTDQSSGLQSTSENLGAMVALRQNEIARLEAQLTQAREAEELRAAEEEQRVAEEEQRAAEEEQRAAEEEQRAAEEAEQAAEEARLAAEAEQESIAEEAQQASDSAATTLEGAVENAAEGVSDALADAGESAQQLTDSEADLADSIEVPLDGIVESTESVQDAAESGVNALTEAGETLGEVEPFAEEESAAVDTATSAVDEVSGEAESAATAETVAAADLSKPWYQEFLESPARLLIAGLGALSLIGILVTLLMRRKDRAEDERLLNDHDGDEFADDDSAVGYEGSDGRYAANSYAAEGGMGSRAGTADATEDYYSQAGESAAAALATDQQDETLSEVEVYHAYGLHSQAEEMLLKATASQPDNVEYAGKLLETYHAQGNAQSFHPTAVDYYQRFNGHDNPQWAAVSEMGSELMPNEALYASASNGSASDAADTNGDYSGISAPDVGERMSSVNREFGEPEYTREDDVTAMMDESIDPAFIFDESDLELTGDLSSVADEIAADVDDDSLDFASLDDVRERAPSSANGESSLMDADLVSDFPSSDDSLEDAVDDLTLDLDQLSGDLEIDSAELLNGDLGDLDLPDLDDDAVDYSEVLAEVAGDDEDDMEGMMDLAKAYLDIGDNDSATSTLDEIVKSGSPEQVSEAENLLRNIS